MVVTVTSIRLKNPLLSFKLTFHGYRVSLQTQKSKGFIKMRNKGFWNDHYTLSSWETLEDVKAFAHSGTHLIAMQQSAELATQIVTYTYETAEMPDWKTAITLLQQNGRAIQFKK